MKVKAIVAVGDSVNRNIGAVVEAKLNGFLNENPGVNVRNIQIDSDLTTVYGKALVVVLYDEGAQIEKPKK